MDAFSGYNQIRMHLEDEEKIALITYQGLYYNKVMPLGLKNIGATYQRLAIRVFKQFIGMTMQVYVDDMITMIVLPELFKRPEGDL